MKLHKGLVFCILTAAVMPVFAGPPSGATTRPGEQVELPYKTLGDRVAYSIGIGVGRMLGDAGLEVNPDALLEGITDGMVDKSKMSQAQIRQTEMELQQLIRKQMYQKQMSEAKQNQALGEQYQKTFAEQPGVKKMPQGYLVKVERAGKGDQKPGDVDIVLIQFKLKTIAGKELFNSDKMGPEGPTAVGKPWELQCNQLPLDLGTIVQTMTVGEKVQVVIPSALGFGPAGYGQMVGPNVTLIAEIDLLGVKENKQAKSNAMAGKRYLSENAKKAGVKTLPSGIQYEVLTEGEGDSPTVQDVIVMDYEGKLIDGTVFDSSKRTGKPLKYPLAKLIKGWQQVVPLMKRGSKFRVVIPSELAYGADAPPNIGPNQVLIFEMELHDFKPQQLSTPPNPGR